MRLIARLQRVYFYLSARLDILDSVRTDETTENQGKFNEHLRKDKSYHVTESSYTLTHYRSAEDSEPTS